MLLFLVSMESDTRAMVTSVYPDASNLPESILSKGILVEKRPPNVLVPKKSSILYINPQTLEQWYEYVDREPTTEEVICDLSATVSLLSVLVQAVIQKWSGNSVAYDKNDFVRLNNGKVYKCIVKHISSDLFKPATYTDYWELVATM